LDYNQVTTPRTWNLAYLVASAANNIITHLTEDKKTLTVTLQDLDNLRAECLFLRSLAHFDMLRLFGQSYNYQPDGPGVPIIDRLQLPTDMPARNTVKEVFDFVVAGLKEAEAIMANDYARRNIADPTAACTKPAIQALLSRVYLYMGQWQNAADYATKVINNTKYRMWTAGEYPTVWTKDVPSAGEVIFEVYGSRNNSYNPGYEAIMWLTCPAGYSDCAASNDLLSLYATGDVRRNVFIGASDVPDLFWTAKYAGKGVGAPDVNNTIVLRLSEMYLNRAEALVNGATISGATALSDLNVITSNRDATPYEGAVTKDDVFKERRTELAFEGHLWFDHSRTGRPMVRNDFTGTTIANKDLPYPDSRWAMPINQSELSVNKNLVQNPGY
jgi:hypothetical protein